MQALWLLPLFEKLKVDYQIQSDSSTATEVQRREDYNKARLVQSHVLLFCWYYLVVLLKKMNKAYCISTHYSNKNMLQQCYIHDESVKNVTWFYVHIAFVWSIRHRMMNFAPKFGKRLNILSLYWMFSADEVGTGGCEYISASATVKSSMNPQNFYWSRNNTWLGSKKLRQSIAHALNVFQGWLAFWQVDDFTLQSPDIGKLNLVQVRVAQKGLGAAWHLDRIEVINTATSERVSFPHSAWLDQKIGWKADLLPEGSTASQQLLIPYKVIVYTSDQRGAGALHFCLSIMPSNMQGCRVHILWVSCG